MSFKVTRSREYIRGREETDEEAESRRQSGVSQSRLCSCGEAVALCSCLICRGPRTCCVYVGDPPHTHTHPGEPAAAVHVCMKVARQNFGESHHVTQAQTSLKSTIP